MSMMNDMMHDERRPRRILPPEEPRYLITSTDWGIHQHKNPPSFPTTAEDLVDNIVDSIEATLQGQTAADPNIVQNAMQGHIPFGRRPVRREWDNSRIGIEIDGAATLFPQSSEPRAIQKLALALAHKLSNNNSRPVGVFFNSIQQAIAARQHQHSETDKISIMSLHDCNVPSIMKQNDKSQPNRRQGGAAIGSISIDPSRGILLVCQPTDWLQEYKPPSPSIGTISSLQTLVARATLNGLVTVVLSPRLSSEQAMYDQSGYQQSATFGGTEPPNQTPWILRDFSPPVYSWVRHGRRAVSMVQSVLHTGHCWHVFSNQEQNPVYLASTKNASGRPTRDVLQCILEEFAE
jgi:hypothetical protein